jgi:hypothetical protein
VKRRDKNVPPIKKGGFLPIVQGFLVLLEAGLLRKIKFVRFKNVSPAIRDANGMEKPHKEVKGFA